MRLLARSLVFVLLGSLSAAGFAADPSKPNILVFYLDDMGWAQPGVYGGKLAPTPLVAEADEEG